MTTTREAKALMAAGRCREAGLAFEELGQVRQAIAAYVEGRLWRDAARLLEADGKLDKALDLYRRARSPADVGRVLDRLGRFEEAGQVFAGADDFASAARSFESEIHRLAKRRAHASARRQAYRWASHFHAKAGNVERATELLHEAGEPERAARVLAAAGRHTAAARLYIALEMRTEAVDTLVRAERPAEAGALCEEIGEHALAARLLHKAGDLAGAVRNWQAASSWLHAARGAAEIEDWDTAGEMYSRAREFLDAGRAFLAAGRPDDAIKALALLKFDDPRYMDAVAVVVEALEAKGDISFAAERFLNEFLFRPLDDAGCTLMYRLARVYEQGEFWETAQEHYEKLCKAAPGFRDAEDRLRRVVAHQRDSAAIYKQVLKEDYAYDARTRDMEERRRERLEPDGDLDAFPDLPASSPAPAAPPESRPAPAAPAPDSAPPAANSLASTTPHRAQTTVAPGAQPFPGPTGDSPTQTVDQHPVALRLEPGTQLTPRYVLKSKLGTGGRGAVFGALDLELDELIAIKVIHPTGVTDQSVAQFRQELKLSRKLTHPNIIRVHDLGEAEGLHFITMEYLDGRDLDAVLQDHDGGAEIGFVLDVAGQICDGLGAAHDLGVIHRDIKPSNVMMLSDGTAKILDFGIAKLMAVEGMTRTGLAYGTPLYMSPEQIRGSRDLDHRTDLYSLGCLMFTLVCGRVPFEAEEAFELLMAHVSRPPPLPSELRPDLPPGLEPILLKLLQKEPDDRFQSCAELGRAIEAIR